MDATDSRSLARAKRKPPPAFPYSPKYPPPDPSDPFAPLQALRDRAHSAQSITSHAFLNPSNASLVPTPPATGDSNRFTSQLPPDLPPLSRGVVHTSRSIEGFEAVRDGYHSDNFRPPRPPRARTRPARDSKSYFSDVDIPSTSAANRRHHDQDHGSSENLTERQYHYRRRSQTLTFFPPTVPQIPPPEDELDQPTTQDSPAASVSHDVHPSQSQYVYDDRQSHGHVYGQAQQPYTASSMDSHRPSHLQMSVHSGPTPPMTPDDTLTLSSVSVRDRSESLSSQTMLLDLPSPPPKQFKLESDAGHHGSDVGLIRRELSRIRTSDFPALLGKSEPDSPLPLPVPPPRPRPTRADSEPEPEYNNRRRSGIGTRDRKDSITKRLRRSSLLARVRKVSDPSIRTQSLMIRDSLFDPSPHHPSSSQPRVEVSAPTARNSVVPEVIRASGASSDTSESKRAKMSHRKSLSHVSLGVTPLPNVSFGPSASASPASAGGNVSMTSTLIAYSDGDEFSNPAPALMPPSQPRAQLIPAQPQPQRPSQTSQTLAQALELTPLPPKDVPLPPTRKDERLPTPPQENAWSGRAALMPEREHRWETQPVHTRDVEFEDRTSGIPPQTTLSRQMAPISGHASSKMEIDEVILMRHPRLDASAHYEHQQSSPSPPLLANSLLARPTSTTLFMPPQAPMHLPPPSSMSAQITSPVISASLPPVRPDIATLRAPSPPPPPRRVPSPLPPRARHGEVGPPTPAPLPLSPPRRIDIDLDTPLPQPPLPSPPPPSQHVPRTSSPIHEGERPGRLSSVAAAVTTRPRSPQEPRQRKSEERRPSDDRQESTAPLYLPVAQVRPHPPPPSEPQMSPPLPSSTPIADRSRGKAAGTPYNTVRQQRRPGQGAQPGAPNQLPFRPHSPSHQQQATARAQSPQPATVIRAQSTPAKAAPVRAQSPLPPMVPSRAVSPPPFRAQSPSIPLSTSIPSATQQTTMNINMGRAGRSSPAPPPPPSSYASHGHTHARSAQSPSVEHEPEREREHGRDHGPPASGREQQYKPHSVGKNGHAAMSFGSTTEIATTSQVPYAASSESTPLPLPNTPSTTFTYPYREASDAGARRVRSSHDHELMEANPSNPARTTRGSAPPRRHHRERNVREAEPVQATFDEHAMPTKEQLQKAAGLMVIRQNGLRVPFGELFRDRKTIVIFIRHFWCAMCQDYMYSIARNVDFEALKRASIDLVVIGNGSPGMIKSYRNIFRMPIIIYTDPSLALYAALGMTRRTNDPGPDAEKGEYIRHGPIGGLAMIVRNALRVGMPVWERGGDATQLGGEFVLGPGFMCTFAHRMTTTRSHAPIRDVLRASGYHRAVSAGIPEGLNLSQEEEDAWMEGRRRSLARIRAKREKRRDFGLPATPDPEPELYEPELAYGYGSDTGSGSVSANGSWVSSGDRRELEVQIAHTGLERAQEGTRRKERPRVSKVLQVSNPDDHHDRDRRDHREHHRDHKHRGGTRVHVAQRDVVKEWNGGTPNLGYINQYGRREDGYDTEEGALPYSYRQD